MKYSTHENDEVLPPLFSRDRANNTAVDFERSQAENTADLYDDLENAYSTIANLREELRRAGKLSSAFDDLFQQFVEYLDTSPYISLDLEANAFLSSLSELIARENTPEEPVNDGWDQYVQDSLRDPRIRSRILVGIQALQQAAKQQADEQAVASTIADAHKDIQVRQPALEEEIYTGFRQSTEGQTVYKEAFDARLTELGVSDPHELAERTRHEAFLEADKAWLDTRADEHRIARVLEAAATGFDADGIDISQLPRGSEVTIWLGSQEDLDILRGKSQEPESSKRGLKWFLGIAEKEPSQPSLYYQRKIIGVVMDDEHDGLMIRSDSNPSTFPEFFDEQSIFNEKSPYSPTAMYERFVEEPKRKKNKKTRKLKKRVSSDDSSPLLNAHTVGHVHYGYRSEVPKLHTRLIAGQPLAYDDDPTDEEFKQTRSIVINAAINRIPIFPFSNEEPPNIETIYS
jgi:hypothetical protein